MDYPWHWFGREAPRCVNSYIKRAAVVRILVAFVKPITNVSI